MNDMGMTDTQFKGFCEFLADSVKEVAKRLEKEELKDIEIKEKIDKILSNLDRIMKD